MSLLGSINKQPVEVLDWDVDYSDFLAATGDTLSAATSSVSPTGLTIDATTHTDNRVKVWLSGGTHLVTYKVTVTATTSGGRVKQDEFRVKVKEI